jgi:hypothetical protein
MKDLFTSVFCPNEDMHNVTRNEVGICISQNSIEWEAGLKSVSIDYPPPEVTGWKRKHIK